MKPRPDPPGRPRTAFKALLSVDPGPSFLGRFDEPGLRQELQREGILDGLAARGYETVTLRIDADGGEHRLRIRPRGSRAGLVDMRLQERTVVVEEPTLRRAGLELVSVLSNNWLSLQDPQARFRPEKPRLPGQRWPGLGLARAFHSLLARWAREWGKDAVLATPEFFHNAVFYAPAFRFLSPAEQGRFEALARDLRSLPIASASAAVEEGRVRDEAAAGVLEWRPGPMAAPTGEEMERALEGPEHRRIADATRATARFELLRG